MADEAVIELSPAGLPLRPCHRCHQVDDAPRCHSGVPVGEEPPIFHMDCHAQLGCPICLHQLKDATTDDGDLLKDHDLRTHLSTLDPLTQEHAAELLGQAAPARQEGSDG